MNRRTSLFILMLASAAQWVSAAPLSVDVPLVRGLTLVSVLSSPKGDRENVVTVEDASADGVNYSWRAIQRDSAGNRTETDFSRYVRTADLDKAQRLHFVFRTRDQTDYSGYTAFTISTAVYDQLVAAGSAPYSVTSLDESSPFGGLGALGAMLTGSLRFKGTIEAASATPEPFAVLLNGERVNVPARQVRGRFKFQDQQFDLQMWVLDQRTHPLILKTFTAGDTLQMLRIDVPMETGVPAALAQVERTLQTDCRAELPGVYFAFGTADLDPASNRTLDGVAEVLGRHTDWTLSVEGHTDNIGGAAANQALSQARADAVIESLRARHRIDARRLEAKGFGASHPRESNDTPEGRARNRRVELVRPCRTRQIEE